MVAVKRRSPKRHHDVEKNYQWDSACGIMTYSDRVMAHSKIKGVTGLPPEEAHNRLRSVAVEPGGFRTHCVRRVAWPLLCGLRPQTPLVVTEREDRYADYKQLVMDVDRSLWAYCPEEGQRGKMREALLRVMNAILLDHPELHYYQAHPALPSPRTLPRVSLAERAFGCFGLSCAVCWHAPAGIPRRVQRLPVGVRRAPRGQRRGAPRHPPAQGDHAAVARYRAAVQINNNISVYITSIQHFFIKST